MKNLKKGVLDMLNLQELNSNESLFVSGGEDDVRFNIILDKMIFIYEDGIETPFMKTTITIGYSGTKDAIQSILDNMGRCS